MYKLKDSDGVEHLTNTTLEACWGYIAAYAKSKDKGYYYRQNMLEDESIWVDYGSHAHTFVIQKV